MGTSRGNPWKPLYLMVKTCKKPWFPVDVPFHQSLDVAFWGRNHRLKMASDQLSEYQSLAESECHLGFVIALGTC